MAEKLAILGRKLGMTRIFDLDGTVLPVTLVQAGPCPVVQVKTQEKDGYHALQIGYGEAKVKHLTGAQRGHLAKAGEKLCRTLREIRLQAPSEFEVGQDITVDIFPQPPLKFFYFHSGVCVLVLLPRVDAEPISFLKKPFEILPGIS